MDTGDSVSGVSLALATWLISSVLLLSSFSVTGGFKCFFPQFSTANVTFLTHRSVEPNALENEHLFLVLAFLHHTHTHTPSSSGKLPIPFSLHPNRAVGLDVIINILLHFC